MIMGEQGLSNQLSPDFSFCQQNTMRWCQKNAFQLDLDAKLFGYHLIPALFSFKTLLVFVPHDLGLIKEISVFDSRRAGT